MRKFYSNHLFYYTLFHIDNNLLPVIMSRARVSLVTMPLAIGFKLPRLMCSWYLEEIKENKSIVAMPLF